MPQQTNSQKAQKIMKASLIVMIVSQQARILAPDIEQCPAKNRISFDESYFTTDTAVRYEVRKFYS